MSGSVRVLQVEDSPNDAELILRALRSNGYSVAAKRVESADEMRIALADSPWDLVISDYRMPGFDAPAALRILQETGRDIPFLVVSGTIGEEVAVGMMKAGAHDYLMKDNLARLAAAVERELRDSDEREKSRQALQRLRENEAQLALAVESTELGVFDYNPLTGKGFFSDLLRRHLQLPADGDPTNEQFFERLHPEDRERVERALGKAMRPESGGHYAEEYRIMLSPNREERWISAWGRVFFNGEKPVRFLGIIRDITDSKRAELALQYQLQLTACITEQSTDCILLADRDGVVRFVNPEMERVFGFTFEEFKAQPVHDLMHHHYPDGKPYPAGECKIARHVISGEILRDHEDVFFHKDGTPIHVSVSCAPVELSGGRSGVVLTHRNITERKRAERELRQSDERFRRLFGADIIGITISDEEHVLEANDYFLRVLGYSREEFREGKISWRAITPPEYTGANDRAMISLRKTGACQPFEKEYLRKDGTRVPILLAAVDLHHTGERRFLCFTVDLTERKNLENQFRQAQKLESIGQLAGGVAHDFNNLLTIILGHANLALIGACDEEDIRDAFAQISAAAERAAELTRQLLTFSRRNTGSPKSIPLDDVVVGVESMLQRLIGEQVEVILAPGAEKGYIHADPCLIEQVILNLAVNARDAMPEGGELFIETSFVNISDEFASTSFSVAEGRYVSLGVTDTGTGMTPEVQARLFEPFFTTKAPGQGTGLGLSTVYGIVQQSGGSIQVESTPGAGTTFRVLFPAMDEGCRDPEKNESAEERARGTETVLVVEDESGVRNYVRDVLEAHGYRTLETGGGEEALELARRHKGPIHLLLTDVVLPGMSGAETIRKFLALRPGASVLRMSGYPERSGAQMGDGAPWIQKPFTPEVLLSRIRKVLDSAQIGTIPKSVGSGK